MRTYPRSERAAAATALVESLQQRFVTCLQDTALALGHAERLQATDWLRDGGAHGGGVRWGTADGPVFGRASINVSTVHYDDQPERKLSSASALSSIVHPLDPRRPSIHLHVSWTEMRDGQGYWRVMADLNPSLPDEEGRERFTAALRAAAPHLYQAAAAQGDRYFFIPALGRHRGVAHFYLESYDSGSWQADAELARHVEEAAIDCYGQLLRRPLVGEPSEAERASQLAYHTVYLFQVLTLDRGTTSGLMVHDQNDEGIMGSLPPRIDTDLLESWAARVPAPQGELVERLVQVLRAGAGRGVVTVDAVAKRGLAHAVREHFQRHPAALELQARGDVVPPTVANHRA